MEWWQWMILGGGVAIGLLYLAALGGRWYH